MYASVISGGLSGIRSFLTRVEVDISRGLPSFEMVGRLSSEVREARERVKVAMLNCGISIPPSKITVNISPASLHKTGTAYDLPIAIGILSAIGEIPASVLSDILIIGELGLNGEVRRVSGVLPIISAAKKQGLKQCIVPASNASEAAYVDGIDIIPVSDLDEAVKSLQNSDYLSSLVFSHLSVEDTIKEQRYSLDFSDIAGQEACKRAALIAAAGFHHMLITGPPGSGKTMIAKRMSTIMPPLTPEECLDISTIYSVTGLLNEETPLITKRPFLNPHHTTTRQALAGGGANSRPGLISLAHKGILFMDEFPEFSRECIETLREPLEDKTIQISRMQNTYEYPADIMLIAAANPCPCGYYPDRNLCNCSDSMIARYRSKISGPMKDRIDIIVRAEKTDIDKLSSKKSGPTSLELRSMVMNARFMQEERYKNSDISYNSEISVAMIDEYLLLGVPEKEYMKDIYRNMNLTARSYHKILKVARTIADIENSHYIKIPHLAEAVCYRG